MNMNSVRKWVEERQSENVSTENKKPDICLTKKMLTN